MEKREGESIIRGNLQGITTERKQKNKSNTALSTPQIRIERKQKQDGNGGMKGEGETRSTGCLLRMEGNWGISYLS